MYLGGEIVLLQLPSFSQVPGPHGVIQAPSPEFGSIIRDVYTAGPVSVALELPAERHTTVSKPNLFYFYSNVATLTESVKR